MEPTSPAPLPTEDAVTDPSPPVDAQTAESTTPAVPEALLLRRKTLHEPYCEFLRWVAADLNPEEVPHFIEMARDVPIPSPTSPAGARNGVS